MEEATIALQAELSTGVWTDLMPDVLLDRGLGFDYGVKGVGPMDLVAGTGNLHFALDNRESNSAAKRGYYTPGHADKRSGWDESIQVRTKFTYGGSDRYKWLGRIASIEPKAGSFLGGDAQVRAVDWMDIASRAKLKQLGIVSSKRVDQILPTIFADMPVPPRATSYATGVETFAAFFNTDRDEGMSVLALLQKAARNEYGLIYPKGDSTGGGTLRFDSRHSRGLNQTSIVTLDQTMLDLDVSYDRQYIYNLVKARVFPLKVDAAATTVLYELQVPLSIGAGQSVTLELPYRDPTTAKRISATAVVDPLVADTGFKFGSSQGTANDLNASLGKSLTIGGNTTVATLTNNASVLGWLNLLKLFGEGIYPYDPQTLEARDQTSIDKRGELLLQFDLEQIASATKGESYAVYLKNRCHLPQKLARRVRFLANQSATLMTAALDGEPSSRFTMKESMTAINSDWFINAVQFDVQVGGLIYCEWIAMPADTTPMWIWNTSKWNTDTWVF